MPFCVAAAVAFGRVDLETFDAPTLSNALVTGLMGRVVMRVDPSLDGIGEPLTQARASVRLKDGRAFTQPANGARGYPAQPATDAELQAKFLACARRTLPEESCAAALEMLRGIEQINDVRRLTAALAF